MDINAAVGLLNRANIESSLKEKLQKAFKLLSWTFHDFTEKGDHYVCVVVGILAKVLIDGNEEEVSLVAKLNPMSFGVFMEKLIATAYLKEVGFFREISQRINETLENLGEKPLRIPSCYYGNKEKNKEVMICEDLRERHFTISDRKKGLDEAQAKLVLLELARLHAASVVIQHQNPEENFMETYPYLKESWLDPDVFPEEAFVQTFVGVCSSAVETLRDVEGYEESISFLNNLKGRVREEMTDQLNCTDKRFKVICHGDCWSSNILFRCDKSGKVQEINMVDFQVVQHASLATDLNYFLFSSLTGEVRSRNQRKFLSVYYLQFSEILQAAKMAVPFSEEELMDEFRRRNMYGLLMGLMLIPTIVFDKSLAADFPSVKEENRKMMKTDADFASRYLAIFDELIESGSLKIRL